MYAMYDKHVAAGRLLGSVSVIHGWWDVGYLQRGHHTSHPCRLPERQQYWNSEHKKNEKI